MNREYGHRPGGSGAGRRHPGAVHCRPATVTEITKVAAIAADARSDTEWRFDVVQTTGHTAVIEVTGEIDLRTGQILRTRLLELASAGFGRIIIDFVGVRFCDAAGLGVLVAVQNKLRPQGGRLVLARVRDAQRRLLRVAGLHHLFPLYDSVPDAVSADQKPTAAPLT